MSRRRISFQPDAGAPGHPAGAEPEIGEGADHRLLEAADIVHDADRLGQPDDGIADQLARAVPGDLAAAIDFDHRGAVDRPVTRLGPLAGRVDAGVLQHEHGVRPGTAHDLGVHQRCRSQARR